MTSFEIRERERNADMLLTPLITSGYSWVIREGEPITACTSGLFELIRYFRVAVVNRGRPARSSMRRIFEYEPERKWWIA